MRRGADLMGRRDSRCGPAGHVSNYNVVGAGASRRPHSDRLKIEFRSMQVWTNDLVSSDVFSVLARIVLTSFFWISGVSGIVKPAPIVATVELADLPMPRLFVAAMIVTELGGSALLVSDFASLGWLAPAGSASSPFSRFRLVIRSGSSRRPRRWNSCRYRLSI